MSEDSVGVGSNVNDTVSSETEEDLPLGARTHYWTTENVLKTIDVAFKNQLTIDSKKARQPPEIKLPLLDHQLALIAAMEDRERGSISGVPFKQTLTYTNYGVLGDEVGTGKSIVVLAYIAMLKSQAEFLSKRSCLFPNSRDHFFTIYTQEYKKKRSTSLIIVPHTIYKQWQGYCKQHTTLDVFYAKSVKDINALLDYTHKDISGTAVNKTFTEIINADVVLISNTLYSEFAELASLNGIHWKRIFVDEADTIYIRGTTAKLDAPFVWFITATWPNFIMQGVCIRPLMLDYYNQHRHRFTRELGDWLKSEIGEPITNRPYPYPRYDGRVTWLRVKSNRWLDPYESSHNLRAMTLLTCSKEFLNHSRQMPRIIETTFMCEQPATFRAVLSVVNTNIQNMIHAGNIDGALQELGVSSDTPMNLVDAVSLEREKELDRLKKTLAFKLTIDYSTAQAKEHAIQSLQTKIASIEEQLKSFRERLTATTVEECPICYDDPKQNSATLTPCCHRIFCGACILKSLANKSACPLCRGSIQTKELIHLVDEEKKTRKKKEKQIEDKLMSKPKRLLKFLKENPDAKVLVFSRYENPFVALERDCDFEGISYHTLRGNKDVIASTIKSFENGEKRVLFLPTESVGAGLNLNTATHVVLIHAMTPEEEKQAIGRAYRLGRTGPLNVIRLLHNGEVNNTNTNQIQQEENNTRSNIHA